MESPIEEIGNNLNLRSRRLRAAIASGGKSADSIYEAALSFINEAELEGKLLEFGAGKGGLVPSLLRRKKFSKVVCADLYPKPSDLDKDVDWIVADLNQPLNIKEETFDVIISLEVIEHLENPRAVFREFFRLLKPGGRLLITTPNQESIRSYCGLIFGGHFTAFLGASYPAHITALVRMDIDRIGVEAGFRRPEFRYTNSGKLPKMTNFTWQQLSFGSLKGRLFSDNILALTSRP